MIADQIADVREIDAERALLGAALVDQESRELVLGRIIPDDFSEDRHRIFFKAIKALVAEKKPIDKITVTSLISRRNKIAILELKSLFDELVDAAFVSPESIEYYAQLIHKKSTLRQILELCKSTAAEALNGEGEPSTVLGSLEVKIKELQDRGGGEKGIDHLEATEQLEQDIFGGKWAESGISTPWRELDAIVHGFRPGEMILWAAAPKIGKSGSVLTLASHVAKEHGAVVYFTLEMSEETSRLRQVAHLSGVSTRRLREGGFNDDEAYRIRKAFELMRLHTPLFYGQKYRKISSMRQVLRDVMKTHGSISTIIVDHAGFVRDDVNPLSGLSKNDRMALVYESMLAMAVDFHAPIHVVQHISREGQKMERPSMATIRDGGNPEGLAHCIILPYRPYPKGDAPATADESRYSREDQMTIGEFIIDGSREGGDGILPMRYYGERNLWVVDTAKYHTQISTQEPKW